MTDSPLNCSILALRAKGDRSLSHSLAGLDVMWMTARDGQRPDRLVHDLYLIADSVDAAQALDFYGHVRAAEPNVPVIVIGGADVALHDRMTGDPAAYQAMSGELTHVRQLVDHLVDGVKARLMDARVEEMRTLVDELAERQRKLAARSNRWQRRLASSDWLAMRTTSMALFTRAGGTSSQFDRLWPGVCAEALGALRDTH